MKQNITLNLDRELIQKARILAARRQTSISQMLSHLSISDDPEAGGVEISPNITAELNEKGELIGIEILEASTCLRDSILESVQAKMLRLSEAKTA